jgi:RND family efflux transporter MFP subunit
MLLCGSALPAWPHPSPLTPVVSKSVSRTIDLPGEFLPYLSVSLYARVPGYVDRVLVDRGSAVQPGDLVAELSAPEMQSQIAEAQAKVQSADASRVEAEAQLAANESVYQRLKKAAETPGAISGNELSLAEKQVDAARALAGAREQAVHAAQAAAKALADLRAYLKVTAPFEGVVTDRLVHPGALAGPSGPALLVIQQVSRLRLVVAVPEEDIGGIVNGAAVPFHVPAYPEKTFTGTVARLAHELDPKTRTMPVEMDVTNRDGSLSPGMYPTVKWPVKPSGPALYVPKTAVVATTERTFVIRNHDGRAEWVDVKKGPLDGDLIAVTGDLRPGDQIVRRGTDEIHPGAPIPAPSK